MPFAKKVASQSARWFWAGLLALWLFSLALRFWGLERFNTLVFDEVYYVKFAHNYLTQTPFFDGHPPLSKYLIAIGMWVGNHLPIAQDVANTKAGAEYTTWSYRWLNALTGSFIPLVMVGIAYQLTQRYRYAFLVGLFASLDGLLLVESRYALNNVYLLLFGLLGLWFFLVALDRPSPWQRSFWLVLAGIFFGASAAIKWNGLWFLLGTIGLWCIAWTLQWLQRLRPSLVADADPFTVSLEPSDPAPWHSPLERLSRLQWWQVGLYLGLLPAVFYWLVWFPHLKMNPKDSFWGLQQQILTYHQHVGSGPDVHPYCSSWYSWLVMQRPVAYFYQVTRLGDPLPTGDSQLVPTAGSVIYDVHAIGNPLLWWLSTIAILLAALTLLRYGVTWLLTERTIAQHNDLTPRRTVPSNTDRWLLLFLLVNYAANLLPWVPVTRCAFLYHYMGASLFAMMALAWLVDQWLHSPEPLLKTAAIAVICLVILAFIFWLPIYLGLPLSPLQFRLRMWLPSWL